MLNILIPGSWCVCQNTLAHIYIHTYSHSLSTYMCVIQFLCVQLCIYTCIYIYIYIYICIHMIIYYIYIHTYIHQYAHIWGFPEMQVTPNSSMFIGLSTKNNLSCVTIPLFRKTTLSLLNSIVLHNTVYTYVTYHNHP